MFCNTEMSNREGTSEFLLFRGNPSSSYENTASALNNLSKLKINCWLQRQKRRVNSCLRSLYCHFD